MKLIEENAASIFNKSSLLLSESVFTSCLYLNGKILFQEDPFQRLFLGAQYLFGILIDKSELLSVVKNKLINDFTESEYSIRITVVKEGIFLDFRPVLPSKNNLVLGLSSQVRYENHFKPSFLKLSNYALEIKELEMNPEMDDLIFFTHDNYLTEATTSNIFILSEGDIVKTPTVSSLVLDGILRKNIISFLLRNNFKVQELPISKGDLLNAKEVFLTNSIKGIRSVGNFEKKSYSSISVYDYIVSNFGKFGEKYYE